VINGTNANAKMTATLPLVLRANRAKSKGGLNIDDACTSFKVFMYRKQIKIMFDDCGLHETGSCTSLTLI
jgi:hypothetical protein